MKEKNIEENNNKKLDNLEDNSNNDENMQFLQNKENYLKNDYFNNFFSDDKILRDTNDLSPKLNLSRYKTSKLFGITFYHIGNLYVFGFINGSTEPIFCLDKKWYFQLIVLFLEIFLAFVGNYYLFRKLELWKQLIYNLLLLLLSIIYNSLILLNPGIVITNQKGYNHTGYCKRCNVYFLPENNVFHCYDCDICVKKLDHHCSVVRKCITKKNLILFISMIVSFILLYVYSVFNLVFYLIGNYKNIKKKI